MPLIRIDVIEGRSERQLLAIGNAVHHALGECLGVPERDRFQIITEHSRARLTYDPAYLGVERTEGIVFVQVFLSEGRSTEQKSAFYSRAAHLIAADAKIRPEDVTIVLIENKREDWSFGNGVAQYLTLPKEQWN